MQKQQERRIDLIHRFDMAVGAVGWPVVAAGILLGLIEIEEKYMMIRPADAFLYIRIYGIATVVILILVAMVAAYGKPWEAWFAFSVSVPCAISLLPMISRSILDRWLADRPILADS